MRVPGVVYLGVVRSPYAHARIKSVDVKPALAHSDVVAAWSGADIDEEWAGSLPCAWIPTEDTTWEPMVPPEVCDLIEKRGFFGYQRDRSR